MIKPTVFFFMLLIIIGSVNALPINLSKTYTMPIAIDDRDGSGTTMPNFEFPLPMDLNYDGYNESIVVCRDSRGYCNTAIDDTKFTVKITLSAHQPINATSGFGYNIGNPYALFFVIVDGAGVPVPTNLLTGTISNNFTQQKFAYLKGNGGANAGIYQINANQLTFYGVEFDPQVYTTKNTMVNPTIHTRQNFTMSVTATDDANITYLYQWFDNGNPISLATNNNYKATGTLGAGIHNITVQTNNLYTKKNDTWTITYNEYAPQVSTVKNTQENPRLKTDVDFLMGVTPSDDDNGTSFFYKWYINGEEVPFATGDDYTIEGSVVGEGTFIVTVQTDNLYTQVNDTWTVEYFEGYIPTYDSGDVSKIAFDFTGNLLVMFVFMAGVIGLGYVFIMYKKANK